MLIAQTYTDPWEILEEMIMKQRQVEVLAPAGSFESMKAAIAAAAVISMRKAWRRWNKQKQRAQTLKS